MYVFFGGLICNADNEREAGRRKAGRRRIGLSRYAAKADLVLR